MKAVVVEDEILIREGLCKLMKKMFPEITIVSTAGRASLYRKGQTGADHY